MVRFIKQRLAISGIALEESKDPEGQQDQKSDCQDRQGCQGNQASTFAGQPFFDQRGQQTDNSWVNRPAIKAESKCSLSTRNKATPVRIQEAIAQRGELLKDKLPGVLASGFIVR
jgi:hypothetical protein